MLKGAKLEIWQRLPYESGWSANPTSLLDLDVVDGIVGVRGSTNDSTRNMANLRRRLAQASVLAVSLLQGARAFYVPGVRPHEFAPGEEVPMKVNSLTSIHTQVREDMTGPNRCAYAPSFGPPSSGRGGPDQRLSVHRIRSSHPQ